MRLQDTYTYENAFVFEIPEAGDNEVNRIYITCMHTSFATSLKATIADVYSHFCSIEHNSRSAKQFIIKIEAKDQALFKKTLETFFKNIGRPYHIKKIEKGNILGL